MRILIWKDKHGDLYYDASTEKKALSAFLCVFQEMEDQGYYDMCPLEDKTEQGKTEQIWYAKAKEGNKKAARALLYSRSPHYEYQYISIEDVQETK